MKKIFTKIFLSVMAVGALTSCDLNMFPHDAISYQDGGVIFTNSADIASFQRGLYGCYRNLLTGCPDYNYIVASEVMCDGFNAHVDYGNNYGGIHRLDTSFTPGDYYVEYCWAYHYFSINDYNIVIAGAENLPETLSDADKAAVKILQGEAYYFRAQAYLTLARFFGKDFNPSTAGTDLCVPLILKYDPNLLPARNTVKEVYDAVEADLKAAAAALAGVEGKVAADHVTIDAVNALYARYYLDVENYAKAAEYAEKVIKSAAGYKFSADGDELYDQYINDSGSEAIMQLYASQTETGNSKDDFASVSKTDKTEEGFCFTPYFLPTKKLVESYEEEDYRLYAWYSGGMLACKIGGRYDCYDDFEVLIKNMGNSELNSAGYPNGYNAVKPFMLSEMYLIDAEANFAAGNTGAAATALNALQTARNATPTSASKENIQAEWFKETVGEGLRMSCLKRWGIGYEARTAQDGAAAQSAIMVSGDSYDKKSVKADDFHFQWPVPSYEMKVNDNLKQNPGYTAE